MARLLIVVEVDADPALVDPHEVGEELVGLHEAEARCAGVLAPVSFVSAEWRASTPLHVQH